MTTAVAKKAAARPAPALPRPRAKPSTHPLMPGVIDDLARTMWYGDSGFGKTTAMATLANVGPVHFLDPEQRMKKSALKRAGVNVDNITRHTDCSYGYLKKLFEQIGNKVSDGNYIAGVCWDAATEQQRVLTQDNVDQAVITARQRGYERSEWKTFQDDYGDTTEQYRRLLRQLLRIDCHVGVTALAVRELDEEEKPRVMPQLTPSFRRDAIAAMDIIMYLQMEAVGSNIERAGLCVPLGRYEAKDTFSVLPRRLVTPTFERVLGYIDGSLTPSNDPVQKAARAARQAAENKKDKEG